MKSATSHSPVPSRGRLRHAARGPSLADDGHRLFLLHPAVILREIPSLYHCVCPRILPGGHGLLTSEPHGRWGRRSPTLDSHAGPTAVNADGRHDHMRARSSRPSSTSTSPRHRRVDRRHGALRLGWMQPEPLTTNRPPEVAPPDAPARLSYWSPRLTSRGLMRIGFISAALPSIRRDRAGVYPEPRRTLLTGNTAPPAWQPAGRESTCPTPQTWSHPTTFSSWVSSPTSFPASPATKSRPSAAASGGLVAARPDAQRLESLLPAGHQWCARCRAWLRPWVNSPTALAPGRNGP